MTEGVIIKGFGGFYFVSAENKIYTCSLRGKLRKSKAGVMTGDHVLFTILPEEKGVVEEILPRRNLLIRPKIANIEQGLIILAAADPDPDWMLLDRLLVLMQWQQVAPILCFNKMDTVTVDHLVYQQKMVYEQAGFPVILASAQTGQGKEALQSALCGKISVVAGPSGAGKSSLLNLLEPGFALTTGSVSDKLGRGRHTTRYVELLPLTTGGWIADSPGFSRLDLPVELTTEALAALYPDFLQIASHCRFDGCLHDQEPDCAVKAACQKGDIDQGRYQRYLLLLEELRQRQQY